MILDVAARWVDSKNVSAKKKLSTSGVMTLLNRSTKAKNPKSIKQVLHVTK